MAPFGIVRSVGAIAVQRPRPRLGQIAVPDLIGLPAHVYSLDETAALAVEDAELDLLRMLGKQREIHALAVPAGAERIGHARPHRHIVLTHACRCSLPTQILPGGAPPAREPALLLTRYSGLRIKPASGGTGTTR